MTIGTEHEFSVNDADFHPLSAVDRILEDLGGELQNEISFGPVHLSKELQKHVIEFTPAVPAKDLESLEAALYSGLKGFYARTENRYKLLGGGMHPTLKLKEAKVWDHEDKELYEVYDCLFDIRQHGWLNIQALQINLPYASEDEMVRKYNKLRALIPYLVAISASSPFVEGKLNGTMDNRLVYYRENQRQLPIIAHGVVPEKLKNAVHHKQIQEEMFSELRKHGGEKLCHEWVDSRGVIVRFSRCCVELKAIDEQECLRADMAVTAFVLTLLRCDLDLADDDDALRELTEKAIVGGVAPLRSELQKLFRLAFAKARSDERRYLPLIATKIENGSLAETMAEEAHGGAHVFDIMNRMETALRSNVPYQCGACKRQMPY
ncbi:MAG TPA: glutamate-cysteine ligase family protein [Methanomassiliicoccales archaeon]|nr:glutamate-cysteine ligase family protein [Methanomassiliicoccales archaeon]